MDLVPDDVVGFARGFSRLRDRSGLPMRAFAAALGYRTASGVQRFLAEDGPADIPDGMSERIREALRQGRLPGISESDLAFLGPTLSCRPSDACDGPSDLAGFVLSLMPIHGRIGLWSEAGRSPLPAWIASASSAIYGIVAPDDAFAPTLRAGDLLIADPLRPPMEGRLAVAHFPDRVMAPCCVSRHRGGSRVVTLSGGGEVEIPTAGELHGVVACAAR